MHIHYDEKKLKRLLDDFSLLTGLSIEVLDSDCVTLASSAPSPREDFCHTILHSECGKRLCSCSDDKLLKECAQKRAITVHACHAGLFDAALPIIKDDTLLGYIMLGRIRLNDFSDDIAKRLSWLELKPQSIKRHYLKMPLYTDERLKSVMNIALAIATYIIVDDIVSIDSFSEINEALSYISENLGGDLSVKALCSALHTSKNVLYRDFRAAMGCTVNEYITNERIALAKKLLVSTNKSLSEIAYAIGLDNPTYFPKLFKKHTGKNPSQYRKNPD